MALHAKMHATPSISFLCTKQKLKVILIALVNYGYIAVLVNIHIAKIGYIDLVSSIILPILAMCILTKTPI